ncbi:MAG: class I SAM-dependent methyltransferase [Candidatus Krumholzibacteria bacterium]|nr:class I SAM-dependent methyltransferase [Candidatus Krumholzibacteria bacterium]MDH4335787.1 class I SAM-dependent methyltransferase [Candidatus Krumholzibacteria bacterium]MDH5269313.1 class I SAM-dependent methyltransferase [Candidatus Krumholzibacteria bacterium]
MSIIRRNVESFRTHGPGALLRAVVSGFTRNLSRLRDHAFDRRFGTETARVVENDALTDVSLPARAHGIRYEPTRAHPLRRALKAAGIPTAGTFVDLGCGKGRVLMLAVEYGFARVTGVDYSASLCEIARRNLDVLRARTGRRFQATVAPIDAADYAFQRDDTVVFLFNPFDGAVLRRVLDNLNASLREHPRELHLIYHRPVWRAAVEESQLFASAQDYRFGGCDFAVYRTTA